MQKNLLIAIALAFGAGSAQAQNITYGGGSAPYSLDSGYNSDYSPDGTIVLPDGIVMLANNATYEHGNNLLQNDGLWSSANSLDLFLNVGGNTISGSIAPSFYNVHFNNGAGNVMAITNTHGIEISGQAQFANGITTTLRSNTSTGAIHFAAGATYLGANADAQHVDGYVSKTGNTAFTFPIGSGTDLRTLAISAPATADTQISTAWFTGNPGSVTDPSDGVTHSLTAVAAPVKAISPAGFWDWINPAGSDENISVSVSIPDVSGFALAANLRLVGWNGVEWVMLSAGPTASGVTENSTINGIIPAGVPITAFAIGSVENPLPVTLVKFTGEITEKSIVLKWTTTEEINAAYFEVQRSVDAKNFQPVGKVDAKGESSVIANYTFSDPTRLPGTNYYRLKQIDTDGSYSFSKTISFLVDEKVSVNVYPNPVTDVLRIESSAVLQSLDVFNLDGSKVTGMPITSDKVSSATSGTNFSEISFRDQKPGIYVLLINGRGFKVIKN